MPPPVGQYIFVPAMGEWGGIILLLNYKWIIYYFIKYENMKL